MGEFFADIHLDAASTSPLSRARRTMTGVLAHHPDITPVVREKLHEIKGRKITDLSFDECNERFDNILMTFQTRLSAFTATESESIPEVYRRFTIETCAITEENICKDFIVVSHGTAVQSWLFYAKDIDEAHIRFDFLPIGNRYRLHWETAKII